MLKRLDNTLKITYEDTSQQLLSEKITLHPGEATIVALYDTLILQVQKALDGTITKYDSDFLMAIKTFERQINLLGIRPKFINLLSCVEDVQYSPAIELTSSTKKAATENYLAYLKKRRDLIVKNM